MLYSTIAKGLKAGPTPVLPVGFDPEENAPISTTTTTTSASKKSKSATSPIDTTKLKTRLCRHFSENNHCPFGDKCAFAHGQSQVTAAPANDDALSVPETDDVALPVATTTTTIKAATPAPSTASDSDDQSSSAPSSSVNIPVPRSRAAAAALPTNADGTTAVISPRPVELMSALPRSASRASLLSNTAAPPKYGFATSRTVSRMSLGGLSDTTDTTYVAPPPASLRRRPTGGVVSRVPSSTAASSSQNQLPPPPPTYESSVAFSDDHSAHSGDGLGRSALHCGCPPNCTCNECTSYDGANWHFQREEVLTPVSQVQTSSPNKSRIPSPMAAGGSGRFSFNPYDPVTPFVMSY